MISRVSQYILLCEDQMRRRLVRAYLRLRDISDRIIREVNSVPTAPQGVSWVINQFAAELEACHKRQRAMAETRLIVVIDADEFSVDDRIRQLSDRSKIDADDPLIILVPKRHIETWICLATDQAVNEAEDCKRKRLEVRQAARRILDWTRADPPTDSLCVPSLRRSLPQWRRIGDL